MNHEVEVSNLLFNKTSDEPMEFKKYDINVELEEDSSNDEKTVLKYTIDLTSNPKNSVINIRGNTILTGEQSEIEEFLKQDEHKTPQVVSLIYQELFPLMYIISKNMKIPSPSHTISQNQIGGPVINENNNNSQKNTESKDQNKEIEKTESQIEPPEKENPEISPSETNEVNETK